MKGKGKGNKLKSIGKYKKTTNHRRVSSKQTQSGRGMRKQIGKKTKTVKEKMELKIKYNKH